MEVVSIVFISLGCFFGAFWLLLMILRCIIADERDSRSDQCKDCLDCCECGIACFSMINAIEENK